MKAVLPARLGGFLLWLPVRIGYGEGTMFMSWLRKRWIVIRHPQANIRFGRDVYVGPRFSLFIPNRGSFIVGDRVEFRRDFRAEVSEQGRVTIGNDSVFTYSVLLQCTTTIDIGERCQFGQCAILVDGQHRFRDITRPMLEQGYDFQPLRIEDDAVVTSKCTVMADIGQRAFVGANSVVSKPIPAYTVAVGSPARPIEYFGPPAQDDMPGRPSAPDATAGQVQAPAAGGAGGP
jgi:acetyltransferase-like isoleucine patch superfamily enzyme